MLMEFLKKVKISRKMKAVPESRISELRSGNNIFT